MTDRRELRALAAVALDAAAIVLFALAGRREHEGGTTVANVLGVAAPFLLGGAAGWTFVAFPGHNTCSLRSDWPLARWRSLTRTGGRDPRGRAPASWSTAFIVWSATLVVGMLARRLAWDRGTALSFIVVAALVLGILMFGWRGIYVFAARRQQVRSSAPPSKADR